MCPTTPPPGFFDLAAPHTPILLWAYGLVSLALVLLAVWSVPRLFRGIPPGHARRSIAWLFGLQAGLVLGGWAIQGLSLLWSDARTHWNASLAGPCISPNQAVANLQSTSALPLPIYMSGVALCFGGLIIGLFVQARIRQTRAELRLPTPAPQS